MSKKIKNLAVTQSSVLTDMHLRITGLIVRLI